MRPRKLQCCTWKDSINPSLRFSWFCVFFVSKGNPFWLLFYMRRLFCHYLFCSWLWRFLGILTYTLTSYQWWCILIYTVLNAFNNFKFPMSRQRVQTFIRGCKTKILEQLTFGNIFPMKIQISLRIITVGSESSLGAFCISEDAMFLQARNEDSLVL